MKADDWQMSKVFLGGGDVQYVLPIFQREYAWEEEEWQTLLDDVIETYHESHNPHHEHFLGSLVVIEEDSKKTLFQSYTLVDGQQRLTSISLLLAALRDLIDAPAARRQIDRYLTNVDQNGELRYKILPTAKYDDREAFQKIIEGHSADGLRSRVGEAYDFFRERVGGLMADAMIDPQQLFSCILSSMYIVFIELERTDKPYKIFESLNHKGKALTEADLVRNYIAMRLPPEKQQEVFHSCWSPIEDMLPERQLTARIPELTAFLRHYLALCNGELPREDEVYRTFRDRIEKRIRADDAEFLRELERLHRFASFYNNMLRPENESEPQVGRQLKRLRALESTTAFPLLLYFYDEFSSDAIDADEFVCALRAIENYFVRRFLAGEPTNYHNSMFTSLALEFSRREASAVALKAALGERNYPSDNRLFQRMAWNRLYSPSKSQRIVFVFETLNSLLDSDVKLTEQGTVEHIMPQRIGEEWRDELGHEWQDVHRELLHTIGNLTIVTQKWNSEKLSNKPFASKRERLGVHGLQLNSEYFGKHIRSWNGDAIRERTAHLHKQVIAAWPTFAVPAQSEGVKGKAPLTLRIGNKTQAVESWRGMVLQMVNELHELHLLTDKSRALNEFNWWMTDKPGKSQWSYRQSNEGWWIQINLTAENAVYFCRMLAEFCGLGDDEWGFTYE